MALICEFPHKLGMDKVFDMALNPDDGSIALTDCSIAALSKYLLTPVLFDKLISSESPDPSQVE
jgi:hypothetical protein